VNPRRGRHGIYRRASQAADAQHVPAPRNPKPALLVNSPSPTRPLPQQKPRAWGVQATVCLRAGLPSLPRLDRASGILLAASAAPVEPQRILDRQDDVGRTRSPTIPAGIRGAAVPRKVPRAGKRLAAVRDASRADPWAELASLLPPLSVVPGGAARQPARAKQLEPGRKQTLPLPQNHGGCGGAAFGPPRRRAHGPVPLHGGDFRQVPPCSHASRSHIKVVGQASSR